MKNREWARDCNRNGSLAMNSKGKVLILTGGGPAPGHNAVIYAATKLLLEAGYEVIGCLDGWKGLIKGLYRPLNFDSIDRIHTRGGTVLGTSRTDPRKMKDEGGKQKKDVTPQVANFIKKEGFVAVIALGGNDTTSVAAALFDKHGVPMLCGPKTIDNDLWGTPQTYGFDTAVNTVARLIGSMHDDFESTHYVGVFEVMGRNNGSLALYGGYTARVHDILIPEFPRPIESVVTRVQAAHKRYGYAFVAVAEELRMQELTGHLLDGAPRDAFDNVQISLRTKGWAQVIAEEITERAKLTARHIVLGHLCRGGPPSQADTIMCSRIGTKLFKLIESGTFGQLVTWGDPPGTFPLIDTVDESGEGKTRGVPEDIYREIMALLPV
jgi:6-phosphofructokinase